MYTRYVQAVFLQTTVGGYPSTSADLSFGLCIQLSCSLKANRAQALLAWNLCDLHIQRKHHSVTTSERQDALFSSLQPLLMFSNCHRQQTEKEKEKGSESESERACCQGMHVHHCYCQRAAIVLLRERGGRSCGRRKTGSETSKQGRVVCYSMPPSRQHLSNMHLKVFAEY